MSEEFINSLSAGITSILNEELGHKLALCITLPRDISWEDYKKELKTVESGEQEMLFRLSGHPKKVGTGDRCYVCHRGFIIGWIGILYITFKSYPLTYKDDGSLLVDPQKMMNDGYGDIGCLIGFCPARYIEKRWVRFKEAGLNGKGIAVSVVGMVPLYFMIKFLKKALDAALGSHFGHLTYSLIMIFLL